MTRDEAMAILAELQPDWTVQEADPHNGNALTVKRGDHPGVTTWNLIDLTEENFRASLTELGAHLANHPVEKAPEEPAEPRQFRKMIPDAQWVDEQGRPIRDAEDRKREREEAKPHGKPKHR